LLVIVVGIAVGVVLAGFAGARRTDSAIPAFVRASGGADAYASFALNGATAPPDFGPEVARLRAIPGVRDARRFANAVVVATDRAAFGGGQALLATIGIDPGGLALFGRPKVIAGRLPRDDVAEETAIDEALARGVGLHVGSTYRLQAYKWPSCPIAPRAKCHRRGLAVAARVVGIVRHPTDLRDLRAPPSSNSPSTKNGDMYRTPAFWHQTHGDIAGYGQTVGVVLTQGRRVSTASVPRPSKRPIGRSSWRVASSSLPKPAP
jgi:hypothetical protein